MILFLPFRLLKDLKIDESYQKAFQEAYKDGKFGRRMIEIAENIQTIHNSLASSIPENQLTAETFLAKDCLLETMNEEDKDNYEDMLAGIGALFLSLTTGNNLKEDAETFDLKFGKQVEYS